MTRLVACSSVRALLRRSGRPKCRSSLFSFPNFSELPWNTGSQPQTYHEGKILPYGQKELYNVVADVESYRHFLPFCTGSRIVTQDKQLHGNAITLTPHVMEAELTVGFLAFKESYLSQVTSTPYESVKATALSSTHLFKTLTTVWQFRPASVGSPDTSLHTHLTGRQRGPSTLVTLDLAYAFANPVHASVSSAFFGQVSKLMVKAFEERCIAVYGPQSA